MQILTAAVLCLLIAGSAVLIIAASKSVANPSAVFAVVFGAQMIASLLLLEEDIKGVYYGFFWLLCGVDVFFLGSVLTARLYGRRPVCEDRKPPARGYEIYDSRTMHIGMGAALIASFFQPVGQIYSLGYRITDLFRLHTLLAINAAAANNRYVTRHVINPGLAQVFLVLVYLLPLIGGWNFIYAEKKGTKILSLCTVTPALLVLFTQNTKAAFIGSVFLFLSGFVAARIQKYGYLFRFKPKRILLLVGLAVVFVLLNYVTFFFREGSISYSLFCKVNYKMVSYLFGEIPAFNYWFSGHASVRPDTWGLKTFYSFSNVSGLLKRVPGIYTEKYVTAHLNTNVYTAFRPLIDDFGVPGALAALFGFGALSGFCFERVRSARAACIDIAVLTALYFYLFYAFITSPWAYVSYTAAVGLFYGYLLLMRRHILSRPEYSRKMP